MWLFLVMVDRLSVPVILRAKLSVVTFPVGPSIVVRLGRRDLSECNRPLKTPNSGIGKDLHDLNDQVC